MTGFAVFLSVVVIVVAFDMWLDRKFPCDCGRIRRWYFYTQHERAGVMMGRALWSTAFMVYAFINVDWFFGHVMAVLAVWGWRRWWFHEKDKLKKKAAKLAGKVGFNRHGRLVVTTK